MGSGILVCDIDNTVLDQAPRKALLLQDHGLHVRSLEELRTDVSLSWLSRTHPKRAELLADIFGPRYLDKLTPAPGAADALWALIRGAADAGSPSLPTSDARGSLRLVYLTGRPASQRAATAACLAAASLPSPSDGSAELRMWDASEQSIGTMGEDAIESAATEAKRLHLRQLLANHDVTCLVSDSSADIALAEECGIPSILFTRGQGLSAPEAPSGSALCVACDDWRSVYRQVRCLQGAETELMTIIDRHTVEYTSFLRDEDTKADIILKVCGFLTALAAAGLWTTMGLPAAVLSIRRFTVNLPRLAGGLFALAITCFLLSAMYALAGVASRHTRGRLTGEPIDPSAPATARLARLIRKPLLLTYNMLRLLFGLRPVATGGPVVAQQRAHAARHSHLRTTVPLEFFAQNYETWDPIVIRSIRMLDLRVIIYLKIANQQASRTMLSLGMCAVMLAIVSLVAFGAVR